MNGATGSEGIGPAPAGVRQRWRLVYRRGGGSLADLRTQRDEALAWEAAIVASGVPAVGLDSPRRRPRIQLGPSLGAGIAGERELADLFLTTRVTRAELREALDGSLPPGITLVDLHDVWTGAPALPAEVVAAEYRVELGPEARDAAGVEAAARRLLAAAAVPRERARGSGVRQYDLRPLVARIDVISPGPPVTLRIRARVDPQMGAGRPEEVLAAIGDLAGRPCPAGRIVRERLVLSGED